MPSRISAMAAARSSGKDQRRMLHRAAMPEVGTAWMRMPRHAASQFERTCPSGVGISRSARVIVPCGMTSVVLGLKFTSLAKSMGSIAASYRIIAERNTPLGLESGCADLSNIKSVSVAGRPSISSSILREHDVLGVHPDHAVAVFVNSQLIAGNKHRYVEIMHIKRIIKIIVT